jgi:hypothetical protein
MLAPPPQFCGQNIFGDPEQFVATLFYIDPPTQIDQWLGLTPGTTQYGNSAGGRCWGLSGVWVGATPYEVQSDQFMLTNFAGASGGLGLPTGIAWPFNYYLYKNSRFMKSEIQLNTIIPSPGAQFQSIFKLVVRQISGNP